MARSVYKYARALFIVEVCIITFVVAVLLYGEGVCGTFPSVLGRIGNQIGGELTARENQWLLIACFVFCLMMFPLVGTEISILKAWRPHGAETWLTLAVLLALI